MEEYPGDLGWSAGGWLSEGTAQGKDDTSAKEKGDVTAAFFRTLSKMLL